VEEIMTPSEVAALLKIHLKTVYKLAEKGVIPGNRIGRSWRFSKDDVLDLVTSKPLSPARPLHSTSEARTAAKK
jgi:excisionase family DNA binding protein